MISLTILHSPCPCNYLPNGMILLFFPLPLSLPHKWILIYPLPLSLFPKWNDLTVFSLAPVVTAGNDYKLSVEAHTKQLMEFQGKMVEACQKFESLEEEHLAQMITFIMKMSQVREEERALSLCLSLSHTH